MVQFHREPWTGKRRVKVNAVVSQFDPRQPLRRPVAGDLAVLHPDQVVVFLVQAADDLLEDVEADLLAVEIDAGPVADEDGRLALVDDLDQAPAVEVGRDELVDAARLQAVPAAEPVARAADDRDDALRVARVEPRCIFNAGRDALIVRKEMPEVVWDLSLENVAASMPVVDRIWVMNPARP